MRKCTFLGSEMLNRGDGLTREKHICRKSDMIRCRIRTNQPLFLLHCAHHTGRVNLDHMTFLRCSWVQSLCSISVFLQVTQLFSPNLLSSFHTVRVEMRWLSLFNISSVDFLWFDFTKSFSDHDRSRVFPRPHFFLEDGGYVKLG